MKMRMTCRHAGEQRAEAARLWQVQGPAPAGCPVRAHECGCLRAAGRAAKRAGVWALWNSRRIIDRQCHCGDPPAPPCTLR